MATFSKLTLSASSNGRGVRITEIESPGTLIHTGTIVNTTYDEVWLYASNTSVYGTKLTLQWGGTTSPNDEIELTVPAEAGLFLLVPGLLIKGNSLGALNVRAFSPVTGVINIFGYVNRITA